MSDVDEYDGGWTMSSLRDLWLPETQRRREAEMRARGVVKVVSGQDVGLRPMTDAQVREVASGLVN